MGLKYIPPFQGFTIFPFSFAGFHPAFGYFAPSGLKFLVTINNDIVL